MKIALFGYGRMGKEVEKVALERNHQILHIIDAANRLGISGARLMDVDMIIDFSTPEGVKENIKIAIDSGKPIVVGTTGWYDKFDEIAKDCRNREGSLFYATNFSLGVNILFKINTLLANLMNNQDAYRPSVEEVHHTGKKDAPSGTAITIAEQILGELNRKNEWKKREKGESQDVGSKELPVYYSREEGVVGYHKVEYTSEIDKITLSHEAFSRKGFALGSVIAAEWLQGKKGVYNMDDLLTLPGNEK